MLVLLSMSLSQLLPPRPPYHLHSLTPSSLLGLFAPLPAKPGLNVLFS